MRVAAARRVSERADSGTAEGWRDIGSSAAASSVRVRELLFLPLDRLGTSEPNTLLCEGANHGIYGKKKHGLCLTCTDVCVRM